MELPDLAIGEYFLLVQFDYSVKFLTSLDTKKSKTAKFKTNLNGLSRRDHAQYHQMVK